MPAKTKACICSEELTILDITYLKISQKQPWLVWLSGLNTSLGPQGHLFDSQSGHMPGLRAKSQVGDVQ